MNVPKASGPVDARARCRAHLAPAAALALGALLGGCDDRARDRVVLRTQLEALVVRGEGPDAHHVWLDADDAPPAPPPPTPRADGPRTANAPPAPCRAVVITLGAPGADEVGAHIAAEPLAASLRAARAAAAPIVILKIDSDGGRLAEVPLLADLVLEHRARARVVAWVVRARSAAALLALCADEIVMTPDGVIGGAAAHLAPGETPVNDDALRDAALGVGRVIAERAGRDPALLSAMQTPAPGRPLGLILDADAAIRAGAAVGAASTEAALAELLGCPDGLTRTARPADRVQRDHRRAFAPIVAHAESLASTIEAVADGPERPPQARAAAARDALARLRALVDAAPLLARRGRFSPAWFEAIEHDLRDADPSPAKP